MTNIDTDTWEGINVIGHASERSSVEIHGLKLVSVEEGTPAHNAMKFTDHYNIIAIEDFSIDHKGAGVPWSSGVVFTDCTNATIAQTWTGVEFKDGYSNGYNVNLSPASCSSIPAISISGSGSGYGAGDANDPHGKLSWP